MKRPKMPENANFWLQVAKDNEQIKQFLQRGNDRQKRNLKNALKYLKWHSIQKRKEVSCETI
jgi:hypothetical protein